MTLTLEKKRISPATLRTFPGFETASEKILREVLETGVRLEIPAERVMCSQGDQCQALPLVLSGNARVFTEGECGREITLYRVFPGETCVLAISCILAGRPSPAFTMAETEGEVLAVPGPLFRGWFERCEFWRTYVFTQLAERLVDVIAITNEAVFRRLDARIASYLLATPANPRTGIRVTHQDLAAELGSSREVVSRILKRFETEGLVRQGRGWIRLADRDGLTAKAATGQCEPSLAAG